jgi:hypothetical protein
MIEQCGRLVAAGKRRDDLGVAKLHKAPLFGKNLISNKQISVERLICWRLPFAV